LHIQYLLDLACFGIELVDPLPAAAISQDVATLGTQVTGVHDLYAKRSGRTLHGTDYILFRRATPGLSNCSDNSADCLALGRVERLGVE